jgi:predicted membrane channel-forming protein YqfA (hemolysin III family)
MSQSAIIALFLGTIIPGLTALVSRDTASPKLKALLTAMLAAVAGGLSAALTTPPPNVAQWESIVLSILLAWISAAAAYFFGWKPSGASDSIQRHTASFGFGPTTPVPEQ